MRTACLWCPDWPVVALRVADRVPPDRPVVVLERGRVRAVSAEARRDGVRRGMRRREAEVRSPAAVGVEADEGLEARAFEVVARALDAVTPRLAVERPGLCSFPARGPARYFGDETSVAERALDAVDAAVRAAPGVVARLGIAESGFAAHLAARRAGWDRPVPAGPGSGPGADRAGSAVGRPARIVAPGETAGFLASRPVSVLRLAGFGAGPGDDLVGLLVRLGIRTLGDLADLPEASVAARFGAEGVAAHRLARGEEEQPPRLEAPPAELTATAELDPPAARVDTAAFAGKGLADRFLAELDRRGLACTRVVVEAETEHGERLTRIWRHQGALTPGALAQRIRWQLDGWLHGSRKPDRARSPTGDPAGDPVEEATGGLVVLRLVPDQVVAARGTQLGFWGEDPEAADRAARCFARLQGMLGPRSVLTPVVQGGRTPGERIRWIPWGDPREPRQPPAPPLLEQETGLTARKLAPEAEGRRGEEPVWPGVVPPPSPARVFEPGRPAEVVDAAGRPVRVSGRGELHSDPAWFDSDVVRGRVEAWTGPWLHDVRWWSPDEHRRRAVFQLVVEATAVLVTIERGEATVVALYD